MKSRVDPNLKPAQTGGHAALERAKYLVHCLNPAQYYDTSLAKPTVIILAAAVIPTINKYFGTIEFFMGVFQQHMIAVVFMFLGVFVMMGIIPAVVVRHIFKESLQAYGLQTGNWREGLTLSLLIFVPICLLLLLPSSQTAEMAAFYPFDKSIAASPSRFIAYQLLRGTFFYTAWEFFFRGFLLFGLKPLVGSWMAICIQTIPSCLWHIGMPTGEIFGSIAGGILFGVLALRTQSILWPLLLHLLIGTGLDFFIVITH